MAATQKTTKTTKAKKAEPKARRNNFQCRIERPEAVAEVAASCGYMVQRGPNTGLRGSIEGLLNAIGNGDVAVVKIVPQDEGPIPGHLEQYIKALGIADRHHKQAHKKGSAP